MSAPISRMQFLRGDIRGKETPIRPPWAIEEHLFVDTCTGCRECIAICPSHIIKTARANFPIVDFKAGECLFCEECVDVCKPKALDKSTTQPWSLHASVDENLCIAFHGVECRGCYDPCEPRAIAMPPRIGGISVPTINAQACTGCGACFSVCPVDAITMGVNQ